MLRRLPSAPARALRGALLPAIFGLGASGCFFVGKDELAARLDLDGDGLDVDDDCDDRDPAVGGPAQWFADNDGDGFGIGDPEEGCDKPARAADNADDCDDDNGAVYPGAPDAFYDGVDADCGGEDADGNGSNDDFDKDADGAELGVDCDDEDPTRRPDPSIAEIYYNGIDEDCDLDNTRDGDKDRDGYWVSDYDNRAISAGNRPLPIPEGQFGGDCWDDPEVDGPGGPLNGLPALTAGDVHPDAEDAPYDGIDADCAGVDVNDDGVEDDLDQDGDGYVSAQIRDRAGTTGDDCRDCPDGCTGEVPDPAGLGASAIYPGASDEWYDGTDADCGGEDDYDADQDGFASSAFGGDDCGDADPSARPGAPDSWYDGVDSDCAGNDDFDMDADYYVPARFAGDTTRYAPTARRDGSGDCWDDPAVDPGFPITTVAGLRFAADQVNPGEADAWYDGVDADCGANDDFDADFDGERSDAHVDLFGDLGDDCDDGDASVSPSEAEVCDNGVDDNCDGIGAPCGVVGENLEADARTLLIDPDTNTGGFGEALSGGADLDADGREEVVVGDPYDSTYGSNAGLVRVVDSLAAGTVSVSAAAQTTLVGLSAGDTLGRGVRLVPDVNGDGYAELLVGADGTDVYASRGGTAYLLLGPLSSGLQYVTSGTDVRVDGRQASMGVGLEFDIGHIDTSSDPDLIVGAPFADVTGVNDGEVEVFSGALASSAWASTEGASIQGDIPYGNLGQSLDLVDVDGDGLDDLVAGAPYGGTSNGEGAVHVVLAGDLVGGGVSGLSSAELRGAGTYSAFGHALSVGDLNGDGTVDLAVGAPYGPTGGEVAVFFGPLDAATGTASTADLRLTNDTPDAYPYIGEAVFAEADVTGDGAADLLVGAPYRMNTAMTEFRGGMWVLDGGSALVTGTLGIDALATGDVQGARSSQDLGRAVGASDVDGDGVSDVLVGAPYYNVRYPSNNYVSGEVLVFTGGSL
jgi:hypothetical protein